MRLEHNDRHTARAWQYYYDSQIHLVKFYSSLVINILVRYGLARREHSVLPSRMSDVSNLTIWRLRHISTATVVALSDVVTATALLQQC